MVRCRIPKLFPALRSLFAGLPVFSVTVKSQMTKETLRLFSQLPSDNLLQMGRELGKGVVLLLLIAT